MARKYGFRPEEMIDFIREMRRYARNRRPGFLVVQQNAVSLVDGHPELLKVIDGIAQEAIWYDGDATDDWSDPEGHDYVNTRELVTYYTRHLRRFQSAGLPVFDCEYAVRYAGTAYKRSYRRGYIPYVTRRALSRLTTTPPPVGTPGRSAQRFLDPPPSNAVNRGGPPR